MQIKEIKPINFLYFETETKITALSSFLGNVSRNLQREAAQHSLHITGPIYWMYVGFTGDYTKLFTLQIALPIEELPEHYEGEFNVKRSENFKCLSTVHEGAWSNMPQTYGKMMQYIQSHQLAPLALGREIYINCDFANPEANFTEIQIGIA